jgi:hypothetical protein
MFFPSAFSLLSLFLGLFFARQIGLSQYFALDQISSRPIHFWIVPKDFPQCQTTVILAGCPIRLYSLFSQPITFRNFLLRRFLPVVRSPDSFESKLHGRSLSKITMN